MIGLALVVALSARLPAEPIEPSESTQQEGTGIKVAVDWSNVRSTRGCFFFSGPGRLGRDDQLGRTACVSANGPVRVTFGAAIFTGSTGQATRVSTHEFHGKWTTTEALEGTFVADGRFSGGYRYEECASGRACPGRCRIDAQVRFTPIGRCGKGGKDGKGKPTG